MAIANLPPDFKELLRLLNSRQAEYLVVGGYAVAYHGYPGATADLDIWIANDTDNAKKVCGAVREFGFTQADENLFTLPNKVVRMGNPPLRVEILTTISGVTFSACYPSKIVDNVDGVDVNSLAQLKANKRASGRHKDLADLEQLESQ
jgi:hypothetical protein